MAFLRIIIGLSGIVLTALVVRAISVGDFWGEGAWLTSMPWGIVSLADLYLGFLLMAVIIALVERSAWAAFWIIPIPFLGNVWIVIWFLCRLPVLSRRLSGANQQSP